MIEFGVFLPQWRLSFEELAERYMAEEKAAFDKMGVPFIFH